MFKDKKFVFTCLAEWILPWLVLFPGIPAIYYFAESSAAYMHNGSSPEYESTNKLFHFFYDASMSTGIIVIIIELILAAIGFVWMIANISKENKKPNYIAKPLTLCICPGIFVFGTLLLMFFVHVFTYGMGI